MCGICGIYHDDQRPGPWAPFLRAMADAMRHRGPDEEGFFQEPDISIGMRRLSVIDLETGAQPMSNEDGSVQVVFNGEIYRFESLRRKLQSLGHAFRTTSDTEVLVRLYEQYGLSLFQYLDGMFAFALWDRRRKRLLLARDRFGIKPLFYTRPAPGQPFAFCSELQPLMKMPGLSGDLDPVAADQYFTLGYILHPRSIYREVRKLAPGTFLLAEEGRVSERKYWDLPLLLAPLEETEALERFDDALKRSVQAMMRSDVSLGAFLSGGLDSSTVVYHMRHYSPHRIRTFSVAFAEKAYNEGGHARLIARHLGTEHEEILARPDDIRNLPQLARHFGEPFADASQVPTYLLSRLARQKVTVALSGDGGDEILGGYETYVASLLAGWMRFVPESIRRGILLLMEQGPFPQALGPHPYQLKKFLRGCRLPMLEQYAAWRVIFNSTQKAELYTPAFLESLGAARNEPVFSAWREWLQRVESEPLTAVQYLDFKTYLIDNNLTKVDRMSMAHSLEVRVPYLDLGVVNAALRLSPSARVRGLTTKVALRKLMRGRLPDEILRLPKRGFDVPISSWFKGPLRDHLREQLTRDRLERTGFVRPEVVLGMLQEHERGRINYSRQLWNLLCFVTWFESGRKVDKTAEAFACCV